MKPKIVIDEARAIALLEQAVAGKENFVYPHIGTCRYARNRKPDCLIAQALHLAGVSGYALSKMDKRDKWSNLWNSPTIAQANEAGTVPNVVFEGNAVRVFNAAQSIQDGGGTWGNALEAGKRWVDHT